METLFHSQWKGLRQSEHRYHFSSFPSGLGLYGKSHLEVRKDDLQCIQEFYRPVRQCLSMRQTQQPYCTTSGVLQSQGF